MKLGGGKKIPSWIFEFSRPVTKEIPCKALQLISTERTKLK
jgi:hypothetical protein